MKKVTVLMLDKGIASTVTGPVEVLMSAGVVWNRFTNSKAHPAFSVTLASVDGKICTSQSGITITPQCSISEIEDTDIVLLTSAGIDPVISEEHLTAMKWLEEQHKKGRLICSVCAGAALLAASGLLNGQEATTHWGLINDFQQRFDKVKWKRDALIVDNGSIITCGGGTAGNDLALYLVEKFCGRKVAMECAQTLLLDSGRHFQAPFAELLHHKSHGDSGIREAQEYMDTHYDTTISLDKLAETLNMSPRNFKRRFCAATGEMPLAYLQKVRIQAAKNLLVTSTKSVEEISASVSYQDCNHFRKIFKRMTSLTPSQFKDKFQRTA